MQTAIKIPIKAREKLWPPYFLDPELAAKLNSQMSAPFLAISQHSLHRTLFCFVPNMVCRMSVCRNESAETIVRRLIEPIFDCARLATSSVIDSGQLRTYCSNGKTIERFIAISPATNRNLIGCRLDLLFVHDEAHE